MPQSFSTKRENRLACIYVDAGCFATDPDGSLRHDILLNLTVYDDEGFRSR